MCRDSIKLSGLQRIASYATGSVAARAYVISGHEKHREF